MKLYHGTNQDIEVVPYPSKEQIREYLISNIIDKMVQYHMEDESLPLEKAMDDVYRSNTIKLLQIPEGELYIQSPAYVYEMMRQEKA